MILHNFLQLIIPQIIRSRTIIAFNCSNGVVTSANSSLMLTHHGQFFQPTPSVSIRTILGKCLLRFIPRIAFLGWKGADRRKNNGRK